jgi:hypothetical protein
MAKEAQKLEILASTPDVELTERSRDDSLPSSQEAFELGGGFEKDLDVTQDDLLEAREIAATLSIEDVHKVRLSYTLKMIRTNEIRR